jgi:hypothetical protein
MKNKKVQIEPVRHLFWKGKTLLRVSIQLKRLKGKATCGSQQAWLIDWLIFGA